MNIEVNIDNLTKEEQEQLNALVEKANKPKSKVWKPEVGESYFAVESSECADNRIVNYCVDSEYDKFNIAIGNCFKTHEEAEFAVEKLRVIAEMKRYITEHDEMELDWENCEQEKHYILYYHDTGTIETDYNICTRIVDNSLYASSSEVLEGMINEIGEDRIKKYYFGVGEN